MFGMVAKLLFMKNTRQKAATIASNSGSLAKSEVCNQSLVFRFIDEKPEWDFAGTQIYLKPAKTESQLFGVLLIWN